jgi:sugar lactone lactonase YvrE
LTRDGVVKMFDAPYHYCNGIALDHDQISFVVEGPGILRLHDDGSREWIIEKLGAAPGDGFCVDVEGNVYVACSSDNCIKVLDAGGTMIEQLLMGSTAATGVVTNCCFGGADRRTLFATHAVPGTVVMWRDLPHAGREVYPWPGLSS